MTSSITFNVGAPTFGVREQSSRFCGASHAIHSPFWNDAPPRPSMNLKTNYLVKPSSNTFNVGAPTLRPAAHPFKGEVFRSVGGIVLVEGKPSGPKGLSYKPTVSR